MYQKLKRSFDEIGLVDLDKFLTRQVC